MSCWKEHRLTRSFIRDRHSAIMSKLRQLENSHHEKGINYEFKLDVIREEIIRLSSQISKKDEMRAATQTAQLTSLKTKLDIFEKERKICDKQLNVIESLYFVVLPRRWTEIRNAHPTTNAWLFDPALTSFVDWLESQDGIYWITGKVCPRK
jgi:hypothetical protein